MNVGEDVEKDTSLGMAEGAQAKKAAIKEIVSMCHPRAVLIFSALALVTAFIAEGRYLQLRAALLLVLAMAFIQVAIGIFNDYCDRDLDRIAKPHRALPAGLISPQNALVVGCVSLACGITAAGPLGLASALVLVLAAGMGILYDWRLKRTPLSWLPYAVAYPLVPIWVWVSLGRFRLDSLLVFPVTIPFSIGVHLCNQLRDYDEDEAQRMRGTAQYLGKTATSLLTLTLLLAGPLCAFAFSPVIGSTVLWISVAIHWFLVTWSLIRSREKGIEPWKLLFKTLQVTSPLILINWLFAIG